MDLRYRRELFRWKVSGNAHIFYDTLVYGSWGFSPLCLGLKSDNPRLKSGRRKKGRDFRLKISSFAPLKDMDLGFRRELLRWKASGNLFHSIPDVEKLKYYYFFPVA